MPFIYRPLLKTKSGEANALSHLPVPVKDRVAPIFHVAENPPTTFPARLASAWANRVCFLDGTFNFNVKGTTLDFDSMFAAIGGSGMQVIPVIEIGAPTAYNQAAYGHLNQFAPGLMLKCSPANLAQAAGYAAQINAVTLNQIDLLIDAGHVAEYDPPSFAGYISQILTANLTAAPWRSVTLASSAAPKDFGQLTIGTTVVPRRDWMLWSNLPQAATAIDYGDYCISHRDLTEPPGVAMASATVSVKYTIDDNWVMVKGRRTTGANGVPMGLQYLSHAQTLVARADFNGLANCWGDQRIAAIAAQTVSAGGRAQWVEIGANRHISFIVDRLP